MTARSINKIILQLFDLCTGGYAVKNGKTPGIFETWDECKKSVDGYSGAVFKSFKTKDEALAFLGIESSSNSEIPIDVDGSSPLILPAPPPMLTEATILPPRNSATAS